MISLNLMSCVSYVKILICEKRKSLSCISVLKAVTRLFLLSMNLLDDGYSPQRLPETKLTFSHDLKKDTQNIFCLMNFFRFLNENCSKNRTWTIFVDNNRLDASQHRKLRSLVEKESWP